MKKVNLNGKLSLNKEVIANLNDDQMQSIKGGRTEILANFTCNDHNTCKCVETQASCFVSCNNTCAC